MSGLPRQDQKGLLGLGGVRWFGAVDCGDAMMLRQLRAESFTIIVCAGLPMCNACETLPSAQWLQYVELEFGMHEMSGARWLMQVSS